MRLLKLCQKLLRRRNIIVCQLLQRLALLEESKSMPWAAVYDYFCLKNNAPAAEDYIATIEQYEKEVTSKR